MLGSMTRIMNLGKTRERVQGRNILTPRAATVIAATLHCRLNGVGSSLCPFKFALSTRKRNRLIRFILLQFVVVFWGVGGRQRARKACHLQTLCRIASVAFASVAFGQSMHERVAGAARVVLHHAFNH
jgi:hypothetical protein